MIAMGTKLDILAAEPPPEPRIHDGSAPVELVAWALERFARQRVLVTTQFGMEGCALLDMCGRTGRPVQVVYLDTMFFFPETYALRDRLAERYPTLRFENRGTTLTPEAQDAQYGPELWKHNPDLCCRLRKVEPMNAVVREADVWLTALRRSQSATRSGVAVIAWDWRYQVLKVSPLAHWSREEVWKYIQENDVPYNPLHERGYPSIGCMQCTAAVAGASVTDYTRAGRWQGTGKTECGLHGEGI
jgi:phosphoadenosine phosphosulfate reductase